MAEVPLGVRFEKVLLERRDGWWAWQPVLPAYTSVIEKALTKFLERYGRGEDYGQTCER